MAKKQEINKEIQVEDEIKTDNGGITPEQIARWKTQHRKVYEITIDDDGELFVGYFCRPNMETMEAVAKLSKTDEIKGASALFANCWLGGSQYIKDDVTLKFAALSELNNVIKITKIKLKNL